MTRLDSDHALMRHAFMSQYVRKHGVPEFYQGPYVPSGVHYGHHEWPSFCHWLVPGFDPHPSFLKLDVYT